MPSPNEHILPTPPSLAEISVFRIRAQLLARNVIAGEFAEPELVRIVLHLLEPELAPDRFEVGVVGVRQGLREIHAVALPQLDFSSLVDHTFAQCGQSHG